MPGYDKNRKAVITGYGVVSPLGSEVDAFWNGLLAGKSVAKRIERFDPSNLGVQFACEVDSAFDAKDYIDAKDFRRMDRFSQWGLAAAVMAFEHSGISKQKFDPARCGVVTGTGVGGITHLEEQWQVYNEKGSDRVSPFFVPAMMANAAAGHISIATGFAGVNFNVTTACAAGSHALGEALRCIREGSADVMMAGGTEAGVTPLTVSAFGRMGALSGKNDDPTSASRPFDKDRDGFVIGEGAAFFTVESLEHATARGATIYAEISGYGRNGDAYHITAPSGIGAQQCMSLALEDAGLEPDQITHINAHGTSTPMNDSKEAQAIQNIFTNLDELQVTSTKGVTGHLIAAAGAVEALAAILTINNNLIPPTANHVEADEDMKINIVKGSPKEFFGDYVLSNSFGFGGHNASIVIARHKG
jgi:3-oxoacyl-[acyl-carrier-protein] synthase II